MTVSKLTVGKPAPAKRGPGLVKLRAGNNKTPQYKCENCKCVRYNPCTCERKVD